MTDSLTGVLSRDTFLSLLEKCVAQAREDGSRVGLVQVDIDHFRELNVQAGHSVGDELLCRVADQLASCLREGDVIGRTDGDEFALMLLDVLSKDHVALALARIDEVLSQRVPAAGPGIHFTVSAGASLFPDQAGDSSELLRCAQAALQDARARGVPGKVYDQALPALGTTEIHARDVDKAIRSSQFDLYFQPKVDLANGRLRGAEALLRWQHPKRGLVGPERVVAVAERSDVIHALTLWVLNVALRNCASWHQAGWPIHVFVNLSTVNLADHEFPMLVQRSLETWQLDPGVLQFEITETAAMDEREQVFRVLEDLTALGVSLSIDDFGTGFSSLAYLQKLPVREIKIDKSFVSQMLHRREDETIVRAIIQLAHSFGLQVTAEGIEDADTYARLQQLECDAAQGFHIARPMEAAAFLDYLEGRQDVPLAIPGRDPLIE